MINDFEIVQPRKEAEVEKTKAKAPNYFWDFLKDISQKKENIFSDDTKKSYTPYMVNRYLSMLQSTVLYAQEMNLRPGMAPDMHYQYLLSAVRPMYRRFEYKKAEKDHEDIIMLSNYYQCSITKARDYFKLHSIEELVAIGNKFNQGGSDVATRRKKAKY